MVYTKVESHSQIIRQMLHRADLLLEIYKEDVFLDMGTQLFNRSSFWVHVQDGHTVLFLSPSFEGLAFHMGAMLCEENYI